MHANMYHIYVRVTTGTIMMGIFENPWKTVQHLSSSYSKNRDSHYFNSMHRRWRNLLQRDGVHRDRWGFRRVAFQIKVFIDSPTIHAYSRCWRIDDGRLKQIALSRLTSCFAPLMILNTVCGSPYLSVLMFDKHRRRLWHSYKALVYTEVWRT